MINAGPTTPNASPAGSFPGSSTPTATAAVGTTSPPPIPGKPWPPAIFIAAHGSTSILTSLVADEIETLLAQLGTLSALVADGELAGIHLEGPFLSPAKPGAHDPALAAASGAADSLINFWRRVAVRFP